MGWFYHDTFSHPVHHLHPKIPCYYAFEAQQHLDLRLGPAAVVRSLSLAWLLDTMRSCKLYDWRNHQWLGFDGAPTAAPIRLLVREVAATTPVGDATAASTAV